MARIKLFALGGLGEDGKNLYVVDVDKTLFILDAGLKYPSNDLYGVDSIVPDLTYLEQRKQDIAGLFLSHSHEDHIGAAPKLLKTLNVPVYASRFTIALLKDAIAEQDLNPDDYTYHTVSGAKTMTFGDVQVDFFATTHSIPESLGIAVQTKDGAIVYAPDYNFDQNVPDAYKTDFQQLAKIASKPVLAVLTESLGCDRSGHSTSSDALNHTLNQGIQEAEGRVIVSTFSTDLSRIQKVIDIALKHDRNIAIIGRKTQRTVDIAIKMGYLKIPQEKLIKLRFIDDNNKNELKDTLVLVTGDRHEPFYMLQRMVKKVDKLIHIDQSDTILLMTPPVPGTERMAARTLDILYRNDCRVITVNKKILPPAHAGSEDVKLLLNILRPRFVVPVIGEYRHLVALQQIALGMGYDKKNILMLDNGQVAELNNKSVVNLSQRLPQGDVLVDGTIDSDLSDIVLRDREMLAQDGVLLIIANIDAKQKKVLNEPEIVSRGFVYMKENEELIRELAEQFQQVAVKELQGKYINWRTFKQNVKKQISNYVYKQTRRSPIIIPVLIDTSK